MRKFTKRITKKISQRFKCSRNRISAVQNENTDLQSASSNQTIEDTSHPHLSTGDEHPTTAEIPSDSMNQGLSREPVSQVHAAPSDKEEGRDPRLVDAELQGARDGTQSMGLLGRPATSVASAAVNAPAALAVADDFDTTYLQPLKVIDTVIEKIANVHPYAKMALGVLSVASKIIIAQAERDKSIDSLLKKLVEVYRFMAQDDSLGKIESMRGIVGKIAQQTFECARFIRDYSETKSFWKRVSKNIVAETDDIIKRYNDALDALMQQFRDQVDRDVAIFVHSAGETLDLSGMTYAAGAGLDTAKQCLAGTRTGILSEITEWINSRGDSVSRVMWLSGPAGKGKSAIAHTIANWFNETGGLGSCFCFDRQREADHRHEKIFSTIARDLADCDPGMKRALADAVKDATSLKNTTDIIQQWRKFLMEPLKKFSASSVGPVLIVIEALDETGGVETRRNLLRILAGRLQDNKIPQITELPSNFRILVTSRPLHDIEKEFEGADHIRRLSMDKIPAAVAEDDIRAFVSDKLKVLPRFGDNEFANLAAKAEGLFEWARLACEYIKEDLPGVNPRSRFETVVNRDPGKWTNKVYDIYRLILADIWPRDRYGDVEYQEALAGFRSVMGQILATAAPLPLASLQAMRDYFPEDHDRNYEVNDVIKHMGSLLSGTTDSSTPIQPLHATFREFLTDKSSSGDFFVERTKAQQRDLAFASLRVMEHGLRFNICDLKSSYLFNFQDTELPQRAKTSIPPHLFYSCLLWATHVSASNFDSELANAVKSFFDNERLLFWVEMLGLYNATRVAIINLPLIAQWLQGHSGYEDVRSTTMDVQRFIQVFGIMISQSTPHLYLSALPFSPINSTMATKFTARFPNNLRLASGRHLNWTADQIVINGYAVVRSVVFSPDGTRIASGSFDNTVRLWDAATGQPLGKPLQGHTGPVSSVSFSPDGTRIASGSSDKTVRLWDAATGQPLGEPLQGHTEVVSSVSFSPDGTRIASGSADNTVRLWDAATGQPLGEPLQGHALGIWSVSFSPDGTRIASGSLDNTVRLWDVVMGQPLGGPLQEHTLAVNSISFSPDGTRIASGSGDKTVRLWDAVTGQPLGEPLQGHTDIVFSVSFSPDGTCIVSGSKDNTVRLWDVATGQPLGEPLQGHTELVSSVSFSPDGTRIVSGSWDNTVQLWDAVTRQPLGEPFQGHTLAVNSISFSPDGTRIASGSRDKTVRLWDTVTRQPLGEPLQGHTDIIVSVSFSPDGTRIASGSVDKTVRLWDAVTGQPLGEPLQGHTDVVLSVSFSPDGTRIASGSADRTVWLWDAVTGQPLGEPLKGHTLFVRSVSFSPDGTRIASGSHDKTVRLWDVASGQARQEDTEEHPTVSPITWDHHFISFSSNSKLEHALCNPADLLEGISNHDSNLPPFLLLDNGWVVGPNHRILFWVPPASRYAFYNPWTSLVIPRGGAELDLSRMAHGTHWSSCRDAPTS